jgi:hypothetical protein
LAISQLAAPSRRGGASLIVELGPARTSRRGFSIGLPIIAPRPT